MEINVTAAAAAPVAMPIPATTGTSVPVAYNTIPVIVIATNMNKHTMSKNTEIFNTIKILLYIYNTFLTMSKNKSLKKSVKKVDPLAKTWECKLGNVNDGKGWGCADTGIISEIDGLVNKWGWPVTGNHHLIKIS